jgi:MFS family permease
MSRASAVQRTYLALTLSSTASTSLIWGVNTLFLLDAGLSATEAFTANAFFTLGQVLFEIPTGVVADVRGRKLSYLLGAGTLMVSTALYLVMWQVGAPFWGWAIASMVIGLGFTFFSGATEAWLVDALAFCGYEGSLEAVFAKGQVVRGVGIFVGAVAGGVVAQFTNLAVPYLIRIGLLAVTIAIAAVSMHDWGFSPVRGAGPVDEIKGVLSRSVHSGLRNRPVRWVMFAAPFTTGVGFYAFYAMQPYLLEVYGDQGAYAVAGLAAALYATAQIFGGLTVPIVRRLFRTRTEALITASIIGAGALVCIGLASTFWLVVVLFVLSSLAAAAALPMRQAFINGVVPSEQRATVLSFDSLMGSSGGVAIQPALGRVADVWGYSASYVVAGVIDALAIPFVLLARSEHAPSDPIVRDVPGS